MWLVFWLVGVGVVFVESGVGVIFYLYDYWFGERY